MGTNMLSAEFQAGVERSLHLIWLSRRLQEQRHDRPDSGAVICDPTSLVVEDGTNVVIVPLRYTGPDPGTVLERGVHDLEATFEWAGESHTHRWQVAVGEDTDPTEASTSPPAPAELASLLPRSHRVAELGGSDLNGSILRHIRVGIRADSQLLRSLTSEFRAVKTSDANRLKRTAAARGVYAYDDPAGLVSSVLTAKVPDAIAVFSSPQRPAIPITARINRYFTQDLARLIEEQSGGSRKLHRFARELHARPDLDGLSAHEAADVLAAEHDALVAGLERRPEGPLDRDRLADKILTVRNDLGHSYLEDEGHDDHSPAVAAAPIVDAVGFGVENIDHSFADSLLGEVTEWRNKTRQVRSAWIRSYGWLDPTAAADPDTAVEVLQDAWRSWHDTHGHCPPPHVSYRIDTLPQQLLAHWVWGYSWVDDPAMIRAHISADLRAVTVFDAGESRAKADAAAVSKIRRASAPSTNRDADPKFVDLVNSVRAANPPLAHEWLITMRDRALGLWSHRQRAAIAARCDTTLSDEAFHAEVWRIMLVDALTDRMPNAGEGEIDEVAGLALRRCQEGDPELGPAPMTVAEAARIKVAGHVGLEVLAALS